LSGINPKANWTYCSGEFYATDGGTGNLELLARFFEKYPEYTERVFLSVKVGEF
jgi:pyridoxine 4-dehydrogenase